MVFARAGAVLFPLILTACGAWDSEGAGPVDLGLTPFEELQEGALDPCRVSEPPVAPLPGEPLVLDRTDGFPCVLVEMPTELRIEPPASDTVPSPSRQLVLMESGRFVSTAQPTTQGTIIQWDHDGTLLRSYGSRGDGPGEFAGGGDLLLIPGPGDSIYVVDDRATWSVFDSELAFARSFSGLSSGRVRGGVHVTSSGQVLTTGPTIAGGEPGALNLMDLDGAPLSPFGSLARSSDGPDRAPYPRQSAYDPSTYTVWVAPADGAPGPLVLEEWTLDGELRRVIRREAPWFPEGGYPPVDDPSEPPMPTYVLLHLDGEGLLWVVATVRSDAWRAPGRLSSPLQGAVRDTVRIRTDYEVRVEVLDVNAGEVVASTIIDNPLAPPFEYLFPGTRTAYRVVPDQLGLNTLEVFDIQVVTR